MDKDDELIERIAQRVVDKLTHDGTGLPGPDLTLQDIQKITGMSRSGVYAFPFAGRYRIGGKHLVRREEFMYRRRMNMDLSDGTAQE